MKKRILSLCLTFAMLLSMFDGVVPVYAQESEPVVIDLTELTPVSDGVYYTTMQSLADITLIHGFSAGVGMMMPAFGAGDVAFTIVDDTKVTVAEAALEGAIVAAEYRDQSGVSFQEADSVVIGLAFMSGDYMSFASLYIEILPEEEPEQGESTAEVIDLTAMEAIDEYGELYYVVLDSLSDIEIVADGPVMFLDSMNYAEYTAEIEEARVAIAAAELEKCYLGEDDRDYPLMQLECSGHELQNDASALIGFEGMTEESFFTLIIEILPEPAGDAVIYSGEGLTSPWGEADWAVTELVLKEAADKMILPAETGDEYFREFYVYLNSAEIEDGETLEIGYTLSGEGTEAVSLDEWSNTTVTLEDGEGFFDLCFMDQDYNDVSISIYCYAVDLSLDQTELTIEAGEEKTLNVDTGLDEWSAEALLNGIEWSSSDKNVATVEDGVVTAVAEGTATVTAQVGGISLTCKVEVEPALAEEPIDVTFRLIGIEAPNESISNRGSWQLGLIGQSGVTYGDYQNLVYETWISTTEMEATNKTKVIDLVKLALAANGYTEGTDGGETADTYYFGGTTYVFSPEDAGSEKVYRYQIKTGSGAFINYGNPYGPNGDWYITIIRGEEMLNYKPASAEAAKMKLQDGDQVILHYAIEPDFELSNGSYAVQEQYDDYIMYCLNADDVSPAEKKQIDEVETLITAIGNVSASSGDAIEAARGAYDALDEALQAYVENYEALTAAEEAFAKLQEAVNLDAPVLTTEGVLVTGTTITLVAPVSQQDANASVMYNISFDGGETWGGLQESNVFEELTCDTTYTFKARFISSDTTQFKNSVDSVTIEIKTGHTIAAGAAQTKTCEQDGWEAYEYCTECDYTTKVVIPAGHTIAAGAAQTKACDQDGWEAYEYCTECDYTTKVVIPAGHTIAQGAAQTKTCEQDGWEAYEYCTECDYTTKVVIPAGHTIAQGAAQTKTCTQDGWEAYEYCTECDYTTKVVIPAGHTIAQGTAQTKTCEQDGWEAYEYCTECDYTTKVVIPKGHVIAQGAAQTKTCEQDGWEAYEYCTECDYTTKVVIPKGHVIAQGAAQTKTCEQDGWEAYEYCTECDYTTKVVIPKGHVIAQGAAQTKTCEQDGWEAYEYCTECDYTTKVVIPAGHTLTKVEAKEATYKETGLEEHWVCEVCEKLFADAEAKTETTLEAVTLPKKTAPITPVGPTKSMADKVEDLIDEIGKVTLDDEEAIDEAREAYEKLTFAQKKQVRNYDELVKAEAALEKLQEEQAAAERVMRFVDVKETDWFYGNVKMAYEKGLIDGTSATNFQPQGLLTVAQTIKLAAALHQMENTGKVTLMNGSDVWYSTYVDYAIANGVIDQSYGDYTDAQMNAAATRSEFVNIFFGAMKAYAVMNSVADNAIPDVKMSDAWADKIYTFYRAGILTGCDAAGTFSPNSNITRGEAATILIRMFDTSARQSITLN